MPVLDRQAAPGTATPGTATPATPTPGTPTPGTPTPGATRRADRIPETSPTPLQRQYVSLSALALVAGAIAITALEMGTPLSSPLVKLCVLVAAPILILTTADAALRIWRSAWAWMPVDVGRGLFRLVWFAAAILGLGVIVGIATIVLPA
jgi:hypothetical protein